jgi:tetratricopeptide (TPR) repeat protein
MRRWLEAALGTPIQLSPATQAAGLSLFGEFSQHIDDYPVATKHYRASLALYERLGDRDGIVKCLNGLGWGAFLEGDYREGERVIRESVEIARELEDSWHLAEALRRLAVLVFEQGDSAEASALWDEALAVARRIGDERRIELVLSDYAWYAFLGREYDRSTSLARESLGLARRLGSVPHIGAIAHTLGAGIFEQGDPDEACTLLLESLAIGDEIGDITLFTATLYTLAAIAASSQRGAQAARIQGAADSHLDSTGGSMSAAFVSLCERHLAPARAHLGDDLWEAERAIGRVMSRTEIVSFVHENVATWRHDRESVALTEQ